jgi:pyridoxamine 5'-phosphate oxidase
VNYEEFRREYLAGGLRRDMLDACPITQFQRWLEQAVEGEIRDPTAMVLATNDAAGSPWQRIVLLKDVSTAGFVFYTNYRSAKAKAMAEQPVVSAHFPWNALDRQVCLAGRVEKLSLTESARYFLSRPRESQLAAWASRQSRPISSRAVLEAQVAAIRARFGEGELPLPDFWGGYRIVPSRIEFWQGGAHRLHDRYEYRLQSAGDWHIEQLQP